MFSKDIAIGINGSMLDDKPTGVGVYSFNLINNLSPIYFENNNRITVFTPTANSLNNKVKIVKLSRYLQSSTYGKLAAFYRFCWNTFYYPLVARKFDLLISPTTHGSFFLDNQIITIHDLLSLKFNNISIHQRFYFKYFLPALINKARYIIAVSENTKKDIIHFFDCPVDKIKVIHNGYDLDMYFPAQENKFEIEKAYGLQNYLLAVGPTYPHKNFEMLIDAYASMDESFKRVHPLLIAGGKASYLNLLKRYVTAQHLDDFIFFAGYVPLNLMPSLYREAFALVFPSLYEGFGIPLLEAMASGCPVIVSDSSSMPEVCGDAALYFNPKDKIELCNAIKYLNENADERSLLIEKGLIQVKKFSWKKMAESFNSLIQSSVLNN
ncbi:MAG: glycosyltransferase family 1 protein [Ferruginibacter sp.]